jgi:hypothetical protein
MKNQNLRYEYDQQASLVEDLQANFMEDQKKLQQNSESKRKKFEKFLRSTFKITTLVAILKVPLMALAQQENGGGGAPEHKGMSTSGSVLLLVSNICTGIYQLWRKLDNPQESFPDFLYRCVDVLITLCEGSKCPPPQGPQPPPPRNPQAFVDPTKLQPHNLTVMLVMFLFILGGSLYYSSKRDKQEENLEMDKTF